MSASTQARQQAIEAFAKVATPEQSARVAEVGAEISAVVAQAHQVQVRTHDEAGAATEFLAQIKRALKRAEEARVFLVKPLNDHAKAINARVKAEVAPLEEADQIVREKLLAHRRDVERQRAEEQARLDHEAAERERLAEEARRAEEARARAAREAAAREAARAEEEARRAGAARREQMQREASEQRQRIAAMSDDDLRNALERIARAPMAGDHEQRGMIDDELSERRRAREAQERAAAAPGSARRKHAPRRMPPGTGRSRRCRARSPRRPRRPMQWWGLGGSYAYDVLDYDVPREGETS